MKLYFIGVFRHRGYVVLRNESVFILMGEMEIWNILY